MYFKRSTSLIKRLVMLALALMLVLSGCGQGQKPKADASSATAKPAATVTAPATPKPAPEKLKFPEKQITFIIPAAAGGATDLLARAIDKVWGKYCPQPVQVVNKATAAGVEGANTVAKAKPDGYTLLISYGAGQDIIAPFLQELPYDSIKDFASVSLMSITSVMIAVPADSPFKTLKDVVVWGKKENKPITAAVATAGSTGDLAVRGFGKTAGINITSIPHQGGAQAVTSLVGSQTMIGAVSPSEFMPLVKAGKLRPLAVSFPERDPVVPEIPTFKEQGVDFYTWGALRGIAAPAGTPREVIDYLADVFKKVSQDEEFKKSMNDLMLPVIYKGPDDLAKMYKETYDGYGKIIKEFGIKP